MSKLTNISRRACVTTVLAAGVALMVTANVADAKGDHHRDGVSENHSMNDNRSGMAKNELKKGNDRYAEKKPKKDCLYITADGKRCGTSSANPTQPGGTTAGSNSSTTQTVRPGFVISGQPANVKGVNNGNGIATISNGVTTSSIGNGKTLTVTSNSPGMITVTNGTNSVTMAGGSLTLSGAPSVMAGSSLEVHRDPNTGDVTFGIKPTVASDPSKANGTSGGTFGDDLKNAGKTAGNATATIFAAPTIAGAAVGLIGQGVTVATIEGHPIKGTEDIAKKVINDAEAAINWVGDLF